MSAFFCPCWFLGDCFFLGRSGFFWCAPFGWPGVDQVQVAKLQGILCIFASPSKPRISAHTGVAMFRYSISFLSLALHVHGRSRQGSFPSTLTCASLKFKAYFAWWRFPPDASSSSILSNQSVLCMQPPRTNQIAYSFILGPRQKRF